MKSLARWIKRSELEAKRLEACAVLTPSKVERYPLMIPYVSGGRTSLRGMSCHAAVSQDYFAEKKREEEKWKAASSVPSVYDEM